MPCRTPYFDLLWRTSPDWRLQTVCGNDSCFGDASVRNFCITKLTLYDQNGCSTLHRVEDFRFSISLSQLVPLYVSGTLILEGRRLILNSTLINDHHFDFITFANSAVSRVTIYDMIVFTHQLNGLVNIVNIGWSPCNGMDIAASGIDSGMHFHPMVPLVALFV